MIEWRPCGQCRALVPADTGCEHWRPGISASSAVRLARVERSKTGRQRRTERAHARQAELEEARQRRLAAEAAITQRRADRKASRVRAQEAATERLAYRDVRTATDEAMAQLHRMMTLGRRMNRMGGL